MRNTLHIERTNTFNWNPLGRSSCKEAIEERRSGGARWWQSLSLAMSALSSKSTCLTTEVVASFLCNDLHQDLLQLFNDKILIWTFSALWACWRLTSTGSPASLPSIRGSSLRSSHSQDNIVISRLAGVCAVRGRGQDLRGGDQRRLLRPPGYLLHWDHRHHTLCWPWLQNLLAWRRK